MKDGQFSVEEIKELIAAVKQNQVEELKIETDNYEIKIKGSTSASTAPAAVQVADTTPTPAVSPAVLAEVPVQPDAPKGEIVKSPIVGTFYESPSPDNPPYVAVGDKVAKGDVLFIIESMKLMNEVTSELDGVVRGIHVQNGDPVEYGQPILTIE